MGIKKRPAASKGLKEGNAQAEQKAENAATTEAPPQPDKVDKARGLQEGQDEDPQATATQKPDETEQGNEAEAATRKRKATPGAPSEAGVSLTSKRLKLHEETQEAIAGLKEGQLSEEEFWKTIHKSDIASLWKKFEWSRGKTPEAQEAWQQMAGPGVLAKKKQALLHFLKTGKNQEGCLQESQEASTSKKDKELFEWVPWKQILDWYGQDEALARVESGTIPVRKDGKKFYEFLLIKKKTALSTEQKQRIATEQSMALKGAELMACKKALQAPRSKQEWNNLWSERRQAKGFEVKDALSDKSSSASEAEEEAASSDEANAAVQFLKGLKEGQPKKGGQNKKEVEKQKQLQKELQDKQREDKKKEREEEKVKKSEAAQAQWLNKIEEATQVAEDDKTKKVNKMLGLVSKAVADMKKACKKASDKSWGAAELKDLCRCRDELEDLSVDCELQGIKEKLLEAAASLKASKEAMSGLA